MKYRRAVTLALECIEREMKRLAANANLEDQYHSGLPACIAASARRTELRAAVAVLRESEQTRMKL